MQITVHVSKHYDWEPLPAGVEPTDADKKALRVKRNVTGAWLMKVTKDRATHTHITMPETQIIALIIEGIIRDKVIYTRTEAVGHYLARHVMPSEAHRNWMKGFEGLDDTPPNAELFASLIAPHIESGKINADDEAELKAAYLKPATIADHVEHLHKHFKVAKTASHEPAPAAPAAPTEGAV